MVEFAAIDDMVEIAELHVASIRDTYQGTFTAEYFKKLSINNYIGSWRRYLQREDTRTLVYQVNNEIIGFAGMCLFKKMEGLPKLDFLHVKKVMQGRGIGRELVKAMKEMLRLEGINAVLINCVEGNENARKFYLSQGVRYIGSFQTQAGGALHFVNKYILEFSGKEPFYTEGNMSLGLETEYERLKPYINEDYILWGVGNYYNAFFRRFREIQRPKYIFDSNEAIQGLSANGVKIVKPHKTELPIIITCSKYQEIGENIKKLGCESYVGYYPWHNYDNL